MSKGIIKKTVSIVVCAALFGGVSGGVFKLVVGDDINRTGDYYEITKSFDDVFNNMKQDVEIKPEEQEIEIQHSEGVVSLTTGGVTDIVSEAMPSVVAITIKSIQEYTAGFWGQTYQYEAEGSGSGIIIGENDTELLIVTNNHVVEGADDVTVAFIDDSVYEAKVKGTDSDNDIAVIAIKLEDISEETMKNIKIAKIGDSDAVLVGEQVVAIGNALGYGQSVTTGIVSAKDRTNSTNVTPLIQTDAAINPGNSGGALLNMNGEVIGINSSKYASTDVEGMGYAIPINAVQDIIDELSERPVREKVDPENASYMGVGLTTVTAQMAEYYDVPAGVYVASVTEDSPADDAGIEEEYIIVKFDGVKVSTAEALVELMDYYSAGERVELECYVPDDNDEYSLRRMMVLLGRKPSE